MEKLGTTRHITYDKIVWLMRFAYWITKFTDTQL